MKKFKIVVRTILTKHFEIEAKNLDDAVNQITDHHLEECFLTDDIDTEIERED